MTTTETLQISYKVQSDKFRDAWTTGINSNKDAKVAMNEMVRILLEEHKTWTVRDALMKIASENEDLEGLTVPSMYRNLSTENRTMLQDSGVSSEKPKSHKTKPDKSSTSPPPPKDDEPDKPVIEWTPSKDDAAPLIQKLDNALKTINEKDIYIQKLETINKTQSEVKKKIEGTPNTKDDCSNHPMYLKAQAVIETERQEKEQLKQRIEELDKIVFVPADKAESPPDVFQVPKDIITGGGYHAKVSPIQAVGKIRQLMNAVTWLEIGWRVIE
jgi:hypothetical protein